MGDQLKTKSGERSHESVSHSKVERASRVASRWFGTSTSLQATGRFLRRQLWAWPIIAAIILGVAGRWTSGTIEDTMRQQRAADLNAMVDATVTAVRSWINEQRIYVQLFADDEQLRSLVSELLSTETKGGATPERQLLQANAQQGLRERLQRRLQIAGYVGYFIISPSGTVIASDQDAPVGRVLTGYRKAVFDQALCGHSLVSKPFASLLPLADEKGELRTNLPTMFVIGPLLDSGKKPIATLGLRIRPEDTFTRILQVVRFGHSGETYAFDRDGVLLSQSRFDDELKQMGLLVDQPDARSILTVELRDPEVNMARGARPNKRRPEQPLTQMAAAAVKGSDGCNADGYRDYRGVPSVGAWRWLKDCDFGVATEIDAEEVFAPVRIVRHAFWTLMALLVLGAIVVFVAMLFIARQQHALQKAALAAKKLGQYSLEEKLGAGGMGTVYKARHAMLRRPTAVKLLNLEKMSEMAIARFHREVQMTSTLTHPNTIVVFDYGRTPDGIFYYAMEYLDGMNLEVLVQRYGPMPEARVVCVLMQVCASLAEAHAKGMVHRDIKPANIILTNRGGLYDFVKVLDFGLVKNLEAEETAHLTNPNALTGTPLYASPEAIAHPDQVDARADIYAVAAVGYYLLTGTPVFVGNSVVEICMKHTTATPDPPSVRLGRPVSPDFENLILQCLSKSPNDRPRNASQLYACLDACQIQGCWTTRDAATWWGVHDGSAQVEEDGIALTTDHAFGKRQQHIDTSIAYDGDTKEASGANREEGDP